jgi:hypothetical protein
MDRPARNVWARGELRRLDLEEAAVTEKVRLARKSAFCPFMMEEPLQTAKRYQRSN